MRRRKLYTLEVVTYHPHKWLLTDTKTGFTYKGRVKDGRGTWIRHLDKADTGTSRPASRPSETG